jgi:DNA repair protein RecN (Recombination protein N)
MLRALEIRDVLIIDRLELAFRPGLNVLTGETGAGKSILLDSLGFVLGWRGRADLVRHGAGQGEVTAVFDLPAHHAAHTVLQRAGLPEGDELILRRINTASGRKTAWVNDRRCSGEVLRALSDTLVELHGQQDDRGLLDPRGHRLLLDEFAGLAGARAEIRAAWTAMISARKAVADTRNALDAVRAEEDRLRSEMTDLDALGPEPGEDAQLDAARRRMQAAEKIRDSISGALDLLQGGEGAEGRMLNALDWLSGAAADADSMLDAPLDALNRALSELGEAQGGVTQALEAMHFNPGDLEDTEERLFAIRALARRLNTTPEGLVAIGDGLRAKLAALDAGAADLAAQEAAARAASAAYDAAAATLGKARRAAAARLDRAVMAELAPLKMERAVFETGITSADPGPEGRDSVAFRVATNPGAPAGALDKIASGGELSRFLLALKVCLTGRDSGITMIFDEIDRGVGGATADAVGRRLAELAQGGQVLVVTHSPQVAARGAHHWRVTKQVRDGTTRSSVVALAQPDRVDEIARMLAGDVITDEARGAARALLAG